MGANQGRVKGNKQKAEYKEPRKKTWEAVRKNGENQRSESGREAPKKTHCEGETGRKRKGRNRGQVARTGTEADERKRKERGNRGSESGDGHRESSCKAEPGREGKEEQKAE